MKAEDVRLTQLLEGPKQFIVPVFQRDYSWGTKHCLQLWNDIVRVGSNESTKAHFVGSVVYIAAEENSAKINRWLLIDGQQRMTTITLLLAALRNKLSDGNQDVVQHSESLPTKPELEDYYLRNAYGGGDRRYKLHLRRADQETLAAMLDNKDLPANASERIQENFDFFEEQLVDADLNVVYRGILKLVAVDVSLTRGQDDPQMIFESLNSTGLDLTQADLIRNFVLMRQEEQYQTELYQDYWQPIEVAFGVSYRTDFDKYVRDYLTLQLKPSKQLKADEIYQHFRNFFDGAGGVESARIVLANLKRFSCYYAAFSLLQEEQAQLKVALQRLRLLGEVASPLVLRLYDCHDRGETLSLDEFVEAVALVESYVFRRTVCAMQTRSLGRIFMALAYRISEQAPLLSLKVALYRLGKKRRFPTDAEFREALETRDIYDMRNCHYLLDRLENESKEQIDTSKFTIEHIMPQNDAMPVEWQRMLGAEWKSVREAWLHRLGNITLTGYNPEYSDRSFADKKTMADGFNDSPLRLNKFVREQQVWGEPEMRARGALLAGKAVTIWPSLEVDVEAVQKAELEDFKAQAARFRFEDLGFDSESKLLFDIVRPEILALGADVTELCGEKTITYRVHDFFLEIVPRKKGLGLLLNLDFDECDDPSQTARDATKYAFIVNASESGGVWFRLKEQSQIPAAMHLIKQAHERISE